MKDMKITDAKGNSVNVSVIGRFRIPDLYKEYVMYSMLDDDPYNENGGVLLGEVLVKDDGTYEVTGILNEEKDVVLAYYNEIAEQFGGEENE
ncbi:MAG: hypothetical protein IJ475_03840 [Bacilli bacterium]|nr:hypothetical protein [Bacilli bacterium]